MKISFHGAAQGVTGSCHLVESGGRRILVDCGLFQGSRELHKDNGGSFGFDPASIDCVLLTHAHLDHCGRLPLLVKRGFAGEIIATQATLEIARLVLYDAAHLEEEEARRRLQQAQRAEDGEAEPPLYTIIDSLDCIGRFGSAVPYRDRVEIRPGVFVTFFNAGHLLGSASILVETRERGRQHSVLFSGDIGNDGRLLLKAPETPPTAEAVVMETTYGDRTHKPLDASRTELYEAINTTVARGGNVLIPTFALERAQDILFFLHQGIEESRLPASLPVFLDSPMAISATEIFVRHCESFVPHVADLLKRGTDPFTLPGLQCTREAAESAAINRITGGAVILAGADMCAGGRIQHHLKHNLWRPQASVVFIGYAGAGTLGRQIIDGAKSVQLFGETVFVRAQIHTINGFSAHADQNELFEWQNRIGGKQEIFLVHGERPAMKAFAARLDAPRVLMPQLNDQIQLRQA